MTHAPRTIGPDALAAEALHVMNARERPITALFVVDGPAGRSASCTSTTCCAPGWHERTLARAPRRSCWHDRWTAGPAATDSRAPPAARAAGCRPRAASPGARLLITLTKWLLPSPRMMLLALIALWPELDRASDRRRIAGAPPDGRGRGRPA